MERKGSAKENIIMIGVLSGDEILIETAKEICGSSFYFYKTMGRLKTEEYAEIIFGNKPRTILIKNNGIDSIADKIPYLTMQQLSGILSHRKDRSERKAAASQVLYNCQLADLPIYPNEKPALYEHNGIYISSANYYSYTYLEIKAKEEDELRGSRIHGMIVGKERMLCLYNCLDRTIKYRNTVERKAQVFLAQKTNKTNLQVEIVFFSSDMVNFVKQVLYNTTMQEKVNGRKEFDVITSKLNAYVIPNGKSGTVYLQLLLYPDFVELLKKRSQEYTGRKIRNGLTLTLATCRAIAMEKGEISVMCTEEQIPLIESMNAGENIHICKIDMDKLKFQLEAYIKKETVL